MSLTIEQKMPIVIEHSLQPFVGLCVSVYLSGALWQNGWSDMDVVWDGRSDGSGDEAYSWVLG